MKLRILVDAHVFDGEFQGTRTFLEGIYNVLCHKKEIELFLAAKDIDNLKTHFPTGKNIHFVKLKSETSIKRLIYEFPALIRKHKIAYAHFQYILPPIKQCRYIVTTHDVIFKDYPEDFSPAYRATKNFLYKRSAQKADIVTTVSEFSKNSIHKNLGIEPGNIHVIPNGVSPQYFMPYDKTDAKNYINKKYGFRNFLLYVSRIEPRKNHTSLLKAYMDLALYDKGYHLVLLGNRTIKSSEFDSALQLLPERIRQFVFLSSEVDNADLLQFYRASDLFVYPSKAEGFGIPPLEAAALGVPVICSNTSAMRDFSFFGKNHIDPNNYSELLERIRAVLNGSEEENLNKLSQLISDRYSWNHSGERLYDIIIHDKGLLLRAK